MRALPRTLLLVSAISAHAFLAFYSFGVAFGIAHMHPDHRPAVQHAVASLVMAITWFPLLNVAPSSLFWPALFLNSTVVVIGGWVAARALSRWYTCRQQSHA